MAVSTHECLESLIQRLHEYACQGFPCDDVSMFLRDIVLPESALSPYIFFKQERYSRNLVYYDAAFELLLLCWGSGHMSPVHGHEGEKCWMRVVQGTLEFTNFKEKNIENPLDLVIETTKVGGTGFVDGPAYIHKVAHVGIGPAMSLHLYARPFVQCDVYDLQEKKKKRIDLVYDTRYGTKVDNIQK